MQIIQSKVELEEYFENRLKTLYLNQKLIPFIGSGFTRGLPTRNGNVPDVSETIKSMNKLICQHNSEIQIKDLEDLKDDLQKISGYFYEYVPETVRFKFLEDSFTNVKLTGNRKKFVNLHWAFIYTLNIDDAIEKNSRFSKLVPYLRLNKNNLLGKVFKLHGDADHEITYPDDSNIIFSKQQYIKSLGGNTSMLSCFKEDHISYNMIFIGCGLNNEHDLETAIDKEGVKNNFNNVDRIYITTSKPSILKQSDLKTFGINVVLVFEKYEDFYDLVISKLESLNTQDNDTNLSKFKNVKISLSNRSLPFNKEFILGSVNPKLRNGIFELPSFLVERDILNKILSSYQKKPINVIVGKRISGKTFLITDIAKRINNKDVYFFPSDISMDDNVVSEIVNIGNSMLIFDSNCLTHDNLKIIVSSESIFKTNNTHVLLVFNSSDKLLLPMVNSIDCGYFDVANRFIAEEAKDLNNKLSQLGLINFDYRKTIIDNIFKYQDQYDKEQNEKNINDIALILTEVDIKILILSATFDKIYSNVYRMLNITHDDIEKSITRIKLSTSIEFEYDLDKIEMHQHSGFKTIVNSKTLIFRILGKYSKSNNVHANRIAEYVFSIVNNLQADQRLDYVQKSLILFDNLNQIFGIEEGGAVNIIFLIYEKLQSLLFAEDHYWIQRAKSIFHLKRNDISQLQFAIVYAKKAYTDSSYWKIQSQASLQIAMIYGRVAKLESYSNLDTISQSVEWYHTALNENQGSPIVKFFLDKAKNKNTRDNDLHSLFIYLTTSHTLLENRLNKKRDYIINIFLGNK